MLLVDVKNFIFFFSYIFRRITLSTKKNFDKFRETVNNLEQRQVEKHHAKRKGPFLLVFLFNTYKI